MLPVTHRKGPQLLCVQAIHKSCKPIGICGWALGEYTNSIMSRKYSFEEKTIEEKDYVIANSGNEPVRVRADWVEDSDDAGNWEPVIEEIVQPDTIDEIQIQSGGGGIDRNKAVEALAGATVDGETIVTNEKQADVLVEYLDKEDIIGIEKNKLVLFRDPDEENLTGTDLMNWAALMNAVIGRIDEHVERVKSAEERFKKVMDELEEDTSEKDDKLSRTRQRIVNLGPGDGLPDPSNLSDEDRKKYDQLKSHYVYLKNIQEAQKQGILGNIDEGVDRLSMAIERLEEARNVYVDFYRDTRTAATKKNIFPEEALNFVENAGGLLTDLAGTEQADEDMQDDEFQEMLKDDMGEAQQTVQNTASESTKVSESAAKAAGLEAQEN